MLCAAGGELVLAALGDQDEHRDDHGRERAEQFEPSERRLVEGAARFHRGVGGPAGQPNDDEDHRNRPAQPFRQPVDPLLKRRRLAVMLKVEVGQAVDRVGDRRAHRRFGSRRVG